MPVGTETGFSLMEAIVATVIATVAVAAIAYSFGNARGLVDRYAAARVALGAAQQRLEMLSVLPTSASDLQLGTSHDADVVVDGVVVAHETWTVDPFTDPASGSSSGTADLKQVTERVTWSVGSVTDTLQLTRLFPML